MPAPPAGTRAVQVQALSLAEPLPGFPGHRDYVLVPADAAGRLFWLQSVAPDGPRFLAVPAARVLPRLRAGGCPPPPAPSSGWTTSADAELYCLVTVPDGDVAAATANLRAPVVVNPATHRARQVVLADGRHPIRRPLRR